MTGSVHMIQLVADCPVTLSIHLLLKANDDSCLQCSLSMQISSGEYHKCSLQRLTSVNADILDNFGRSVTTDVTM